MAGLLRIGTCSWKYPSWSGLVYSSPEPPDYLAEYAARYDSVEVDQWFWSLGARGAVALPRPEVVAGYAASTPADFRFAVKCPNALTLTRPYARGKAAGPAPAANPHFLDGELFLRFIDSLVPLVPRICLFVFQFEYLNRDKMPGRASFMDRLGPFLDGLPRDLPYAVEIRNPAWMDASWFSFLAAHGASPVLLQGYWMDPVVEVAELARGAGFGRICLRLHGEDREGMEKATGEDWSRVVRPKDAELEGIAGLIQRLLIEKVETLVYVNNHYEGSAPLTIGRLRGLLEVAEA